MNNLLLRRRALMGMGGKKTKIEGIRILVDPRHSDVLFKSVDAVNKMYIDGAEVEVKNDYSFTDNKMHEVILQLTDNTRVPNEMFFLGPPKCYEFLIDFPNTFVTFGDGSIRSACYSAGDSGAVVIRSTTLPTFGSANFIWNSQVKLYVPDELITDYTTMLQNDDFGKSHVSQLKPLSEYVEQ